MDHTKILTLLCTFLLLVCLTLSIVALTVMRNATDESLRLRKEAHVLLDTLDDSLAAMSALVERTKDSLPTFGKDEEGSVNTDGTFEALCIRLEGGRIGVYTESGRLLRILDLDPASLPPKERAALEKGIPIRSWQELIQLIQDYAH